MGHQFTKSLKFTESKPKMKHFVGLTVFLLAFAATKATNLKGVKEREWGMSGCDGQNSDGDKCCRMNQGDCDWDSDCCEGLVCGFDWGWSTDVCVSGPNTRNYTWTDWTEWSDCSVSCGGTGEKTRTEFSEWSACEGMCGSSGSQSRTRSCIEPTEGGQPCPEESTETATQECNTTGLWASALNQPPM